MIKLAAFSDMSSALHQSASISSKAILEKSRFNDERQKASAFEARGGRRGIRALFGAAASRAYCGIVSVGQSGMRAVAAVTADASRSRYSREAVNFLAPIAHEISQAVISRMALKRSIERRGAIELLLLASNGHIGASPRSHRHQIDRIFTEKPASVA